MRLKSRTELENYYLERDAIRWLMQDQKTANASMVKVIKTGIHSSDWEMQLVCMIACAFFDLDHLKEDIQQTKLDFRSEHLYDNAAHGWALEIQQVVIKYLQKELKPLSDTAKYSNRELYILHCILRKKIDQVSDIFLFANGMRIPNGIRPIAPHRPAGIRQVDHTFYLHDTKIELVHVPSFKHWIGAEAVEDNPIQQTFIKTGFFISKYPLSLKSTASPTSKDFVYLNYPDAKALVGALSKKYNLPLIIPSVNASEMASRGQTGRLYPWGNKLEEKSYNVSPWLMEEAFGSVECWTSTSFDSSNNYTYGSWKQKHCGGRVIAPHRFKRAIRIAIAGVFVK